VPGDNQETPRRIISKPLFASLEEKGGEEFGKKEGASERNR